MSATILVVEHEPRYAERMKEALSGQPLELHFAKDGEEALQVVEQKHPSLIVLSSVIPRISTADLIRQIKSRTAGGTTPILITVSGYTGRNPKADAMRLGADDIVPKPFPETTFAEKVQQLLRMHEGPKLTSSDIFGDLFSDEKPPGAAIKPQKRAADDVDKLLAKTLSDIPIPPRKKTEPWAAPSAGVKARAGLDRLVEDTLSGLEKSIKTKTSAGKAAAMAPPASAPQKLQAEPPPIEEKILISSPLLSPVPEQPAGEEPTAEPGSAFGQYVLVERIARGGMAEVWKARMRGVEGFEKVVAIKRILPHLSDDTGFVDMFIDEAKLAAQLNHNNIIHIYDLGRIGSSYYIAMEYVEGHDLKGILRRAHERDLPMPIELALLIASKVAAALDYAHRKRDFEQKELGIVHRDVSPQNVLISTEGDIKLCDFGIAKAASKVSHTLAGALKGKLQYMSPEQAWGRPIDRRSDIFALATVLFEMLTGRRLFSAENEMSLLDQVREARAELPSKFNEELAPEIDAAVLKALQREPDDRYQTAAEMARDIDGILYIFRPTPTSADLAIYLDRLYAEKEQPVLTSAAAEPEVVPAAAAPPPVTVPPPPIAAAATPHPWPLSPPGRGARGEGRRRLGLPIAAGLMLVGAGVVGAILFTGKREPPRAVAPSGTAAPAPSPPPAAPVAPVQVAAATAAPTELTAVTDTAAEQALIDEEVRRRLASERARLDEQRSRQREQERARMEEAAAPAQQPEAVAPPPPVEQQPESAPASPVQTTAVVEESPTVHQTQPPTATVEPVSSPPQPPAVREGDLVASGTPGLVEPELLDMKRVPYPPIARMQRVSGTVIISALVSERGQVIDARVLRGVSRNVGINEAALEMVRGAIFRPGTLDGVRVKAYKTIVVPFTL